MIIVTSFFDICPKYTCEKCGKPYGKTNLRYEGIEIWAACDCTPKDKAYMLNMNIDYDKLGIPDLMPRPAQKEKNE